MAKVPSGQKQDIKPVKQKWNLKKKIIVVLGTIVVFIVGIFIIATVATDASLKISDKLVTAIKEDDSAAVYNLMSSSAKDASSINDVKTAVEKLSGLLTGSPEVQNKEIKAETGKSTTAKVVYKIAGSDGNIHILTVNLVEEDKEWKIQNFESKKK